MSMALSPSRAADYRQCPLLYRLRAIDKLPEEGDDSAAVRGTIVHRHLDEVFDVRNLDRFQRLAEIADAYADFALDVGLTREAAIAQAVGGALLSYLELEDPADFQPTNREWRFEVTVQGVPLRGVIDRLDHRPGAGWRVVDYKSGKAPRERFEAKALWQLKLYAVAFRALRRTTPARLRLMYLGGDTPDTLDLDVTDAELDTFERLLVPLWAAILRAGQTGDFRPRPSKLCPWCPHHASCPEQGGTPPPYPGWPDDRES